MRRDGTHLEGRLRRQEMLRVDHETLAAGAAAELVDLTAKLAAYSAFRMAMPQTGSVVVEVVIVGS
jgi:hypothetical protein